MNLFCDDYSFYFIVLESLRMGCSLEMILFHKLFGFVITITKNSTNFVCTTIFAVLNIDIPISYIICISSEKA